MQGGLKCPKCRVILTDLGVGEGADRTLQCPTCQKTLEAVVFPKLFRASATAAKGESATDGEATCFYHPQKKAVLPCDSCGRFLCALCDVDFNGQHLCPACLETGARKKNILGLERERTMYAQQAFVLGLMPVLVTGPFAIYLAIRHWKEPGSIVRPRRWAKVAGLVLGIIQTLVLIAVIISIIKQ